MTSKEVPTPWLRYDEAMRFANGLPDLARRQFVLVGLMGVVLHLWKREEPAAPFDLLYLAKALDQMFEGKAALERILAGEDLRWWNDE